MAGTRNAFMVRGDKGGVAHHFPVGTVVYLICRDGDAPDIDCRWRHRRTVGGVPCHQWVEDYDVELAGEEQA